MVNINNKPWDKLRFRDIEKFLSESGDENFFFEFKIGRASCRERV